MPLPISALEVIQPLLDRMLIPNDDGADALQRYLSIRWWLSVPKAQIDAYFLTFMEKQDFSALSRELIYNIATLVPEKNSPLIDKFEASCHSPTAYILHLGYLVLNSTKKNKDKNKATLVRIYEYSNEGALLGNSIAQYNLGLMYINYVLGVDFEKRNELAAAWFSKAAEAGDISAQNNLSVMYDKHWVSGVTSQESSRLATVWCTKAAEGGDITAQNNLGVMYREHRVHNADLQESNRLAVKWYTKAAEAGNIHAQNNLGSMYRKHLIPDIDPQESDRLAVKWYTKAAEAEGTDAQFNLGLMYAKHDVPDIDPQESDRLAVKWYTKAAEMGDIDAQNNLGVMYKEHRTEVAIQESDRLAIEWFKKAAQAGSAEAQVNLGEMYEKHLIPNVDAQESDRLATAWFHRAAEAGNITAQFNLGAMYKNHRVASITSQECNRLATEWFRKAAEAGHSYAQFAFSQQYKLNCGVPESESAFCEILAHYWAKRISQDALKKLIEEKSTPSDYLSSLPTLDRKQEKMLTLMLDRGMTCHEAACWIDSPPEILISGDQVEKNYSGARYFLLFLILLDRGHQIEKNNSDENIPLLNLPNELLWKIASYLFPAAPSTSTLYSFLNRLYFNLIERRPITLFLESLDQSLEQPKNRLKSLEQTRTSTDLINQLGLWAKEDASETGKIDGVLAYHHDRLSGNRKFRR